MLALSLATGLLAAFAPLTATAATSWSDSFETYAVGSQMHGQGGWKGWDNVAAAGALVAATPARTGTRSVAIAGNSDLVQEYNFATTGKWVYTAWQYIPTTFSGRQYFILMNTYQASGSQSWSVQVWMDTGSGKVGSDFDGAKLPLVKGRWVELRVEIDLTANVQKFYYDNQLLYQKSWTAGVSGWGARNIAAVDLYANGTSAVYYDDISLRPANFPPTIATPATVSAATVTGTCINATVLAADDGGESNLVYTWSATGPAAVTFAPNASNPAKATQATFTQSGAYQFTVQVADAQGLTTQSTVSVTVAATPARVVVTPATVARDPLTTCQFSAQAFDQFNALLASQPALTWSAQGISINAAGLATADGDAAASYTVLATAGSIFGSAILQINSVPTPPAPVITPNGGTFDQPLAVTITPAVSTVLGNTPGWRTGVKYPGQGIETVEALSQDGTTVGAMRGRTMAKSSYLFPGANMSPDIGSFPFYIWNLADNSDTQRHSTYYRPSLFAGVTENTAWDGNGETNDFYFPAMGNRVFLLLEQHYRHAISLWSCADGAYQYETTDQMLTQFPLPSVAPLAGTPLKMEFAADKVRILMGGTPLVSDATDANGWVTYTGPSATRRVNEPLGATRFWLSLAGGELPGPREFVVSDKPLITTRFTYDGSDVTETSLAVTSKLTLTHDAIIKARCFSAAYPAPSAQTVAVFDSLIPELPAESYVSPVYADLFHATLDGSPALVSLSGPSGSTNALALDDNRFTLRYPLLATGPTPVTLHRSGIPDLSTNILWRAIDLAQDNHPDPMPLRLGDSLLLTASAGPTDTVQIVIYNASNQVFRSFDGLAGDKFTAIFDQFGAFIAVAYVNGVSVGSMAAGVVYVNFDGPIACGVGFTREKGVEVFGPVDQVFFTNKNANLEVSVKEQTGYGVRLYLKPTSRNQPVIVQARLGSITGPILAEQKIDAFDLDYSPIFHLILNGATRIANTHMTMKPWVPNLDVNCEMFASFSTFADGSTAFGLNTSDFSAKNVNGDPSVRLIVDPTTGETQAVLRVDFGIPPDESSYCFQATFDQHSKYGTPVHRVKGNGKYCGFTVTPIWINQDCKEEHTIIITEDANNNTVHSNNWLNHEHPIKAREQDKNKFAITAGNQYNCVWNNQWEVKVKLNTTANPAPKAGDEYKVVICGDDLTEKDDNSFLAIKVLGFELEPITVEGGIPPQNSCGIAKGEKSKYVIKVMPAAIPDNDISWSAVNIGQGVGYGAISFPDGNKGRSVNIKGDELGLAKAKVTIAQDCNHLNKPTIEMEVFEKVKVKVSVYVTFGSDAEPARSKPEIEALIVEVNKIYAQLAVEFVLDEKDIHLDMPAEYFNLASEAKYEEMQSIGFNTRGVEIYFVKSFLPWMGGVRGYNFGKPGINKSAGLTIAKNGDAFTLAHEIGHCGQLDDIYDQMKDQQLPNDLVKAIWEPKDWNSGPDPAYYERTLVQPQLIKRLLMYGYNQLDPGTDIPNGQVWGIDRDGNPACLIPVGKQNFMPMTRKPYHW